MQYEVEHDGTYYYGSGRNWMERIGGSLEDLDATLGDLDLIDRLEQAVKDYEYEQYRST